MQVAVHEQVGGCQNFWMAKDEFVDRFGLAREIPLEVQELLAVARARQKPRRGGGEHPLSDSIILDLHIPRTQLHAMCLANSIIRECPGICC